ncbi:hypothetical protein [Streptomyces sp. NPDC002889]|uniref:hypothetical protein n=1 Tax=Streptomyces sp. NPDC002889 TaxID=3364669 RepID=UPI0036900916
MGGEAAAVGRQREGREAGLAADAVEHHVRTARAQRGTPREPSEIKRARGQGSDRTQRDRRGRGLR